MPYTIALNIDLGESDTEPPRLYTLATTVNIACGGHAGDADTMRAALGHAAQAGARVAAHPSYPDRAGFGRRARFADPETTRQAIESQCRELAALAASEGIMVDTVKPHGALYHDASDDADYAAALIDGASAGLSSLVGIVGPPDTALEDIVRARGLRFVREGFADRRYEADMKLVPRSRPDALLLDAAACVSQALWLARIQKFDTLCMHGDTPSALSLISAVHHALAAAGLLVARQSHDDRTTPQR